MTGSDRLGTGIVGALAVWLLAWYLAWRADVAETRAAKAACTHTRGEHDDA